MSDGRSRCGDAVDALLSVDDTRFVLSVEADGFRVAHCSPGLCDRLGIDDVEGDPVDVAFAECLGNGIELRCRECRDGDEAVTHLGGPGGDTVYETELVPVSDEGTVGRIVGTVRDVTERERLRTELDRTSALFDAVLENVPIHLYVKDRDARHLVVSDFYVENLPFVNDRSELLGKTDPEVFPGEMGSDSLADDRRVIEEGEPILKSEAYVPIADMWTLTSKIPWVEDGETKGLIGVTLDVTRRKQYADRLERKTEQLEEFASIITHDLRNPLNLVEGYLDLARETGDAEHFEEVERAIDRAIEITNGLERLVRASGAVDPEETVDAADVARRAWDQVGTEEGALDVDAGVSVDADPNWLRTLFENVFRNAVEHAGEDVRVEVGDLAERAGFFLADDGPGIPVDRRDQVFESGESTKEDGGMGLWIVARVADAHGWELSVEESRDGGARFEVLTDP